MSDTTPRHDDPAVANSPDAPGGPPDVTDRVAPGPPPPGSNQAKDEPTPTAGDVTGAAGTVASDDPQSPHAVPERRSDSGSSRGAEGAPGMIAAQARPRVDLGSGRGGAARPISHEGRSGASRVPGQQETLQSPLDPVAELDAVRTAPGAPPQSVSPGTSAAGDAQGVNVPGTESAPGTSQQSNIVEGVRSSPDEVARQPEGEVDTRN